MDDRWIKFHEKLMALEFDHCDEADSKINDEPDLINYDKLRAQFSTFKNQYPNVLKNKISQLIKKDENNPAFSSLSLLRVLDKTGLRETAHTRILAWLFDSKNEQQHGFKDLFIPILQEVTKDLREWPKDGEYTITNVESEKLTKGKRRIDIWVEGYVEYESKKQPWLIVIEAKIESFVGDGQLWPYEEEAHIWKDKTNGIEPCFVLLTYKENDSEVYEQWQPLSFANLFNLLWFEVRKNPKSEGYHFCRNYLTGILSDIYKWKLPLNATNTDYHAAKLCDSILKNHS